LPREVLRRRDRHRTSTKFRLHNSGALPLVHEPFKRPTYNYIYIYFRSYGFPNNLETYGLISGLWTSTFALGAFVGPSIAGILYDSVGFRNGTMFVVILNVIVVSERRHVGNTVLPHTTFIVCVDNY